jgi:hypothetical protein
MNIKIIKAKILRFLGITKPIPLDKYEIQWIKLCKGHYDEKYGDYTNWIDTLKPMFIEIYGYNPDEDSNYDSFLDCIFNKLFSIYLKIHDETSSDLLIKEVIQSTFYKRPSYNYNLPIERCIASLCGKIQGTDVLEVGVNRFYLD